MNQEATPEPQAESPLPNPPMPSLGAAPANPNLLVPTPKQPQRQQVAMTTIIESCLRNRPEADILAVCLAKMPELQMGLREASLMARTILAIMPGYAGMKLEENSILVIHDPKKVLPHQHLSQLLQRIKIKNVCAIYVDKDDFDMRAIAPEVMAHHGWQRIPGWVDPDTLPPPAPAATAPLAIPMPAAQPPVANGNAAPTDGADSNKPAI